MNTPTPTNTCRQCGGPMASNAPEGLCARCLLSVALKEPESSDKPDGSEKAPSLLPSDFPDIGDSADVARRLPQFEILELLGRGGMGVVYKARQLQLDRVVALKILPPADALSPDFVERFRREARSLAKLSHPNIVTVYEFGETGGLYYFVMEVVDGVNLRDMIRAGKMKPEEALAVVPKICDALQFAHEEGVVHRDIKPENILIDKRGRVKIADFGLAKLLRREQTDYTLTTSGMTLGTPRYMAPEQLDKPETVDHRADIYSLGVVFYEMLTGEVPMGRFAPPSQKVQIDVRLDEIVLHALERDVSLRYQHASEMKSEVETVSNTPRAVSPPQPLAGKRWPAWVWWTLLVLIPLFLSNWAEFNRNQEMLGHNYNASGPELALLLALGVFAAMKLIELRSPKIAEPFSRPWLAIIVALFSVCLIAVGPFPHVEWFAETLKASPQKVATAAGATFELAGFSQTYVKHGLEFWQGWAIALVCLLVGAFLLFAPRKPRWNVARSVMVLLAGWAMGVFVGLADKPLKPHGYYSVLSYSRPEVDNLEKSEPAFRQFREDFRRHAQVEASNNDTALEQLFAAGKDFDELPKKTRLQDYPSFGLPTSHSEPAYGSVICNYAALALILIGTTRLWQTLEYSPAELAGIARFFRTLETWICLLLLVPCLLAAQAMWVENWAALSGSSVMLHMQPEDFSLPGRAGWSGPWVEAPHFSQAGSDFWQGRIIAAVCVAAILVFIAVLLKLCKPGALATALCIAGVVSMASAISFENGLLNIKAISWHDFHAVAQHGAMGADSAEVRALLTKKPKFVGLLAQLEKNVQTLIVALTSPEVPPTAKNDEEFKAQLRDLRPGQAISQKFPNMIMTETMSADGMRISPSFVTIIPTKTKLAQARVLGEGGIVTISENSQRSQRLLLLGLGLIFLGLRAGYRCWKNRHESKNVPPVRNEDSAVAS